jgi:hypothetical protein
MELVRALARAPTGLAKAVAAPSWRPAAPLGEPQSRMVEPESCRRSHSTFWGAAIRSSAFCSGGRACAPASEGPSGATVEAAGGSPQIRQGGRSAAQSARTRAGLRKRKAAFPRSPALGRTHNDGAPVPKLGQGLFSEIATFTIESGPTTPRCLARFVAAVSRDGAP